MAVDDRGERNRPIYAGGGAPSDAEDLTYLGQLITQLGTRRVGTAAERAALDPAWLYPGLDWFESDTKITYRVNDAGQWVLQAQGWTDFTFPSYSQISGFSNTYSKIRRVGADKVELRARFTAGTSFAVGNGPSYTLPVAAASWLSDQTIIGDVLYRQGSLRNAGKAIYSGGTVQLQTVVAVNGQLSGISSSTPNGWATGHWFEMVLEYPVAIS